MSRVAEDFIEKLKEGDTLGAIETIKESLSEKARFVVSNVETQIAESYKMKKKMSEEDEGEDDDEDDESEESDEDGEEDSDADKE